MDHAEYWNERYNSGRGAGAGSTGRLYAFKLETVQRIVDEYRVDSVVDYGCGDGAQLRGLNVLCYIGLDISRAAIEKARLEGSGKQYDVIVNPMSWICYQCDLWVSLDVIMHLPDEFYEAYMHNLFGMSTGYVLIYAPNLADPGWPEQPHMFPRRFTDWIDANTEAVLIEHIPNRYPATELAEGVSFSEFFLYEV